MPTDLCRLRPGVLCRLLNSTPLGQVINTRTLLRHREQAGLRVGDERHVDLIRYTGWLIQVRHFTKPEPARTPSVEPELVEAVLAATKFSCRQSKLKGHGQKFTQKHEVLIAALLTEPTHVRAAAKAGISTRTLYRWLAMPEYRAAYDHARRSLVTLAIGRLQAASGPAADVLVKIACHGRRDSDRIRAASAILNYSIRDQSSADLFPSATMNGEAISTVTRGIVQRLEVQMQQVERSTVPLVEKTRLLTTLTDALLRALHQDEIVKRMETLETVLQNRKDENREKQTTE